MNPLIWAALPARTERYFICSVMRKPFLSSKPMGELVSSGSQSGFEATYLVRLYRPILVVPR